MATRTGSVKKHRGVWTARVTFTDPSTGKRREVRRRADNKAHACEIRDEILRSLDDAPSIVPGNRKTFSDLTRYYREHYVQPAEYSEGRKVAGMRSFKTVLGYLLILEERFSRKALRSITYGDLRTFRADLMRKATRLGKRRSIANTNRIMAIMRRLLRIAHREGWVAKNPFNQGESLISIADEKKRERVITIAEEEGLLAACEKPRRRHLRPIIVCALATGMRFGEIAKLRWSDVDLENRLIQIEAQHTKTLQHRSVGITSKLYEELATLKAAGGAPDQRVFGISTSVKRAFAGACRDAGVTDLHFHDLRHSVGTRLTQGGMQLAEVGRILGHSEPRTSYRYINRDATTLDRAASILGGSATLPESQGDHVVN